MASTPVKDLSTLSAAAGELVASVTGDAAVTGVAYDSRVVQPGDLFFCVVGEHHDGHRYAADAVAEGAAALCVERVLDIDVPQVVVEDVRRAMAVLASAFFDHPASSLLMLGITGTNGKTTTAFLLESILRAAGRTPGLIGTIETRIAGERRPGVRTTPESVDLQRLLAEMRDRACDSVAMEVTSHALALDRVAGIRFASAGFTNLSQDHLDFHSGMEDYFEAKRLLFQPERATTGAVNVDDDHGRRLFENAAIPTVGFGYSEDAAIRASDVNLLPAGSTFDLTTPVGTRAVSLSLAGAFNVYNALAAAAVALQAGIDIDAVAEGLSRLDSVPGRFESVVEGQDFAVIVDYAHTPDSLDNVLRAARRLADISQGRVLCTFGCGGDRDRAKRPLMGAVVARLADVCVVTSDNPRSEDPVAIIDEILEGVVAESSSGADAVLPDRREAIDHVLRAARPGDVVVIAGKGHETGQEFSDRTIPFDDRVVAGEILRDLLGSDPA
ncbi:MAG TPA: UDP-N-acetylmuramoyl-L-alanyl-D-glutamate--2,6-diaminopimelate ligase [Actinomycetota bacterium]|nr:UDP-N-acetylmuramoyl-L-alanyl-D-glutamate--2,6-diaminopimelate ligase [Actinomycetota bacterium]